MFWFLCILGVPYCGIGATIRNGREIRCLPYAEFFYTHPHAAPLVVVAVQRAFKTRQKRKEKKADLVKIYKKEKSSNVSIVTCLALPTFLSILVRAAIMLKSPGVESKKTFDTENCKAIRQTQLTTDNGIQFKSCLYLKLLRNKVI